MLVKMGCKKWTLGTQLGLRIYTDTIRKLESILNIPSSDNNWRTLTDFIKAIKQGKAVRAYSRNILLVSRGKPALRCTMTIAKHGRTTQGYITAPHNTWFYRYVSSNMGRNYELEYVQGRQSDLLMIPQHSTTIQVELERDKERIKKRVNHYCRNNRLFAPPNSLEIGLFYEIKEKEHLESQGLVVSHRYPYFNSRDSNLLSRQVSCDIDVFDASGKFLKFVEVKSVTASPGAPFNISINEFNSRRKCQRNNWKYEIVVYYHFGNNIIERRVINLHDRLGVFPSGYSCFPI